jgi:hypothetical protein
MYGKYSPPPPAGGWGASADIIWGKKYEKENVKENRGWTKEKLEIEVKRVKQMQKGQKFGFKSCMRSRF